ncbi:MAG: chemotaxis protein CheD [Clostridia bacterium]|nr:chemotaxis protein CheD [Clostridia bacterium]
MDDIQKYYLQPGFIFVSREPHFIHTVLGSCVSVCIWDDTNFFGGMNHYIYHRSRNGERNGRVGDASIPYLIKLILELGAQRNNLKAHIVGGAQNPKLSPVIGLDNVRIAEEILSAKGISVITKDIGGLSGRKIIFNSGSGEILVYKGANIRESDWYT